MNLVSFFLLCFCFGLIVSLSMDGVKSRGGEVTVGSPDNLYKRYQDFSKVHNG